MFDRENFIAELDRFELSNPHDISSEEIHAIMDYCKEDEDPLFVAVFNGFLCGCMKAGVAV